MAEVPINIDLYPDAALPKSEWPKQMSMKSVIDSDIERVLVARRAVGDIGTKSYSLKNRRFLTQDALDDFIDHDLSMNIIGRGFLAIHAKYKPINGVFADWDGVTIISKGNLDGSIVENVDENCFPATYYAYNLHMRDVPYFKSYNKVKEAESEIDKYKAKLTDILLDKKQLQYIGSIILTHKPTMCNYWHVTLNFLTADGKLLSDHHKTWCKGFVRSALNIYMEEIITDPENYTKIFIQPTEHDITPT